jgi:hypothetical protein
MQNSQELLRTQRIMEHLAELWRYPQEPSPDELRHITEFVIGLQEPYRTIGLEKIAEHTISNMSLHILALMATFQQKAEQEGIRTEDRKETFDHIQPVAFGILRELGKNISVQSLDDLAALTNITVSLQTLSRHDSAEAARSWLYELPTMYYRQLTQEMVVRVQVFESVSVSVSASINWIPFNEAATGFLVPGIGPTQMAMLPKSVEVPVNLSRPAA